ncbi:MAG: hypothetical protein A2W17_05070 [Planctomycetes bacterium RBG_16_41_13]|nr:MAG: hypothetical protein A2W17_05070 [Planctomycetes bacterium RBG_16_41_13]
MTSPRSGIISGVKTTRYAHAKYLFPFFWFPLSFLLAIGYFFWRIRTGSMKKNREFFAIKYRRDYF